MLWGRGRIQISQSGQTGAKSSCFLYACTKCQFILGFKEAGLLTVGGGLKSQPWAFPPPSFQSLFMWPAKRVCFPSIHLSFTVYLFYLMLNMLPVLRTTRPILALSVVIWMHLSWWIQISQWKFEFKKFSKSLQNVAVNYSRHLRGRELTFSTLIFHPWSLWKQYVFASSLKCTPSILVLLWCCSCNNPNKTWDLQDCDQVMGDIEMCRCRLYGKTMNI